MLVIDPFHLSTFEYYTHFLLFLLLIENRCRCTRCKYENACRADAITLNGMIQVYEMNDMNKNKNNKKAQFAVAIPNAQDTK